ncbi:uncharacterized protein [Mobula birostris]|uniref:uncharacterized protein n=1 Tax=Mobula birostris TaxID=1983395 RepID=UPI003B27CE72
MSQGTRRHLTPNLSQRGFQETLGESARQRLVPAAGTPADPGLAGSGQERPRLGDHRGSLLPPPDGGSAAQGNTRQHYDEVSIKVESPAEGEDLSAEGKPRTEPGHRFTFHSRASKKKKPLQAAPLGQTEPRTPRLPSLADGEPERPEASGPRTQLLTQPERPDSPRPQREGSEVTSDAEPLRSSPRPQAETPDWLRPEDISAEASNDSSWLTDRESLLTPSVLEELAALRDAQRSLELSVLGVVERHQRGLAALEELLQEERQRSRQLQVQLHDLMDLHQNELNNLEDNLANLEEKIAYQSYESSRDIWEVLEAFQSKLLRLEQLQQVSQAEQPGGHELLGKSMNLLLMMAAVALTLMSTLSALVLPFVRTRTRTLTTCALCLLLLWLWGNWDSFRVQPTSPKSLQG